MKKLLLSLLVGLIGLINFGFCSTVQDLIQVVQESDDYTVPQSWTVLKGLRQSEYGIYCLKPTILGGGGIFDFGYSASYGFLNAGDYYTIYPNTSDKIICIYVNQPYIYVKNSDSNLTLISYELFRLDELLAENLPIMTKGECQTEYNLIPIEDVDQDYCVSNQLCPDNSGSGDLQFSNIYINDILHPGKQNIFVNIPDYIVWDYNVVGDDFNIYVGSGYDVDYINSIIDINSYRPTSGDFTNVFVGGLTLIFPYIVIVLFIVFIRKLIKRIFK